MYKRIDNEIKDRIIEKIKKEGLSVLDASKEFEISAKTIYAWIGSKGRVEPGALELARLKRENNTLKQIIGQLMLNTDKGKKNS